MQLHLLQLRIGSGKSRLHSSRKVFLHTLADMCSTCLSGRERHWCQVIGTATAPQKPTEMSVIPRGFLSMPAVENTPGVALFPTAGRGKSRQDTDLRIPSGTTPPGGSCFTARWLFQIVAAISAPSLQSCGITANANKPSTICSVGCGSTAKGWKPDYLMKWFSLLQMCFYFGPPRAGR